MKERKGKTSINISTFPHGYPSLSSGTQRRRDGLHCWEYLSVLPGRRRTRTLRWKVVKRSSIEVLVCLFSTTSSVHTQCFFQRCKTSCHHGEADCGGSDAEDSRCFPGSTPSPPRRLGGFFVAPRFDLLGSLLWILRSRDGVFHPGRSASFGGANEKAVLTGAGSFHDAGNKIVAFHSRFDPHLEACT